MARLLTAIQPHFGTISRTARFFLTRHALSQNSEIWRRLISGNLRSAIIKNNRNLLNGKLPSYDRQIKKAQERGDIVSVNHRITAFLESYFDVIFALNRQTHPGEKRQVQLCKKYCTVLPKDFEENINALIKSISGGGSYEIVTAMVNNLDEILNDEFK